MTTSQHSIGDDLPLGDGDLYPDRQHRFGRDATSTAVATAQRVTGLPTPTPASPWIGVHRYMWRTVEVVEFAVLYAVSFLSLYLISNDTVRVLGYLGILAFPAAIWATVENARRKRVSYRRLEFDGTTLTLFTRQGTNGTVPVPDIRRVVGKRGDTPHVLQLSVAGSSPATVSIPERMLTIDWFRALMVSVVADVDRNSTATTMLTDAGTKS